MSKEALISYIREQYHDGTSREHIIASLAEKGWSPDIIEQGITEVFDKDTLDIEQVQTISSTLSKTLSIYAKKPTAFLLAGAVSVALPLLIIALFSLPLVYAFIPLELRLKDFLSLPLLPLIISHLGAGVLFTIVFGSLGSIILTQTAIHEGNISIEESSRKAWSLLPGFFHIKIEMALITLLLTLPGIVYTAILGWNFFSHIRPESSPEQVIQLLPHVGHIIAACATLIIPSAVFSLFASFSVYAFLIHGTRGIKAIRQSIHLVSASWKSILWKVIVCSFVFSIISSILTSILPILGAFIAGIVISPAATICFVYIYKNYHHAMNTHRDESVLGK